MAVRLVSVGGYQGRGWYGLRRGRRCGSMCGGGMKSGRWSAPIRMVQSVWWMSWWWCRQRATTRDEPGDVRPGPCQRLVHDTTFAHPYDTFGSRDNGRNRCGTKHPRPGVFARGGKGGPDGSTRPPAAARSRRTTGRGTTSRNPCGTRSTTGRVRRQRRSRSTRRRPPTRRGLDARRDDIRRAVAVWHNRSATRGVRSTRQRLARWLNAPTCRPRGLDAQQGMRHGGPKPL